MRVLIVGNAYSIHVFNFINESLLNMNIENIVIWDLSLKAERKIGDSFDLFYTNNSIKVIRKESDNQDAYYDLIESFEKIKGFGIFDVCHLHYLGYTAVTIGLLARKICKCLVSNYWGSDWLRANETLKQYQRFLLEVSDYVVTDSLQIFEQVNKYYREIVKDKIKYIRFKTQVINEIDSIGSNENIRKKFIERYHIPSNKIIITCGYCASKAHDHKGIIDAIKNLPVKSRDKLFAIMPMTYGNDGRYVDEIKQYIKEIGIDNLVIEDFLNFTEVAILRFITDIFINIEPTDAYSSTMVEYTYCNKIVIIGKWLDYSELEKKGAYFKKISGIKELTNELEDTINNFSSTQKKFQNNRIAAETFQKNNDENELWIAIYDERTNGYETNSQISLFEIIEKGIGRWIEQNKYKNIGVYGMGLLGGIVCQKVIEVVGPDHVHVFDQNVSKANWYSGEILKPDQMAEKEMDVIIVTPSSCMEEIKSKYKDKIVSRILTYVEWLEELEKVMI